MHCAWHKTMLSLAAALLVVGPWLCIFGQEKPETEPEQFGGTYEQLTAPQKHLVDLWFQEYEKATGQNLPPTTYNQLALSVRTTFEAVTHALMITKITGKDGKPAGDALDLVEEVETVNGKVPKARGDLQFRMYALLKPDALERLQDSQQFLRERDNTVYHHGYPLNYRQQGGAPSIQFSMAVDGRHADIDVDYRSSKFPNALFNGHLTAGNSDVRAGNNLTRHNERWAGLKGWWQNFLGLLTPKQEEEEQAMRAGSVPSVPAKGKDKLQDAVHDFFSSWLVEQKPEHAAAYFSPISASCLDPDAANGAPVNFGIARYRIVKRMRALNQRLGRVAKLEDVVTEDRLKNPKLRPMKQPYQKLFTLYEVPNRLAIAFECSNRRAMRDYRQARVSGTEDKYGKYFGSVMRLGPSGQKGSTIAVLWGKQTGFWEILAWEVEPPGYTPAVSIGKRPDIKVEPPQRVQAGPAFLSASRNFLETWLVARNYASAAEYINPLCYPCVDIYLPADKKKPENKEQYAVYLREALRNISQKMGPAKKLSDVLEPIETSNPNLKLVSHPDEDAYTLIAVPKYIGESFLCKKRSRNEPYHVPAGSSKEKDYGKYYGMIFKLRVPGDQSGALILLWQKEHDRWKIVAYGIEAP